jgi:hypothetical protein
MLVISDTVRTGTVRLVVVDFGHLDSCTDTSHLGDRKQQHFSTAIYF